MCSAGAFAQVMSVMEDSIMFHLNHLRTAENDAQKTARNEILKHWVEETVKYKEALSYSFDKLKTMGTVKSPDEAFRLFNWNIEKDDGTYEYFCYVVKPGRGGKNVVIPLADRSHLMRPRPSDLALDNRKWFGALYYKVIPVKKGGKTLYTLLAWDGNNRLTTKKFVEIMHFSGSKKVKFGYPMIKTPKGVQNRYFVEFMSEQFVTLRYSQEKKEEIIVFDHLSPKAPQLEEMYEHYVTDGSYDALRFENGYWVFVADYYAVNKEDKDKLNDPTKNNYDHDGKEFVKPK